MTQCIPRGTAEEIQARTALDGYTFETWCGRTIRHPGYFGPRGEPVWKSIDVAVAMILTQEGWVCPACCDRVREVLALPREFVERVTTVNR